MGAVVLALREVPETEYGEEREEGVSAETRADPDALEELGDEIATLAAHIHAATHRLLELIARFDRLRGWETAGHRGCAEWLAFRTGMDVHTAREHVRVARALEELPETSASMARGRLSFSKARALTRVADRETEADLLPLAEGITASRLERVVRAWKKGSRQDEAARARELHGLRRLSIFPDEEGLYVIRGRLEPEVGAVLMRAIEAAADALYRKERGDEESSRSAADGTAAPADVSKDGCGDVSAETSESKTVADSERISAETCGPDPRLDPGREAARRRADALGLVAERALAAGFGAEVRGGAGDGSEDAPSKAPVSGTRAERYQVLLHVDADTLSADREPGRSELGDGTRVSAETSRRLACDAAVVRVEHGRAEGAGEAAGERAPRHPALGGPAPGGSILSVGRRTRTIPPALRRALEVRDRGCRFPGCGLRFTDAHHVEHWADGGETSLDNCLLLCRFHHRLVHEGGWTLEWWGKGRAMFRDPRGNYQFEEIREDEIWTWNRAPERAERSERAGRRADPPQPAPQPARQAAPQCTPQPTPQPAPQWTPQPAPQSTPQPAPQSSGPAGSVPSLLHGNLLAGADPGPMTASARWKREHDIPDDVWFRATGGGLP